MTKTATAALEVKVLYRIVQLIGSAVQLDKTLSEVLKLLNDTLRMERATLVLQEESGKALTIRASYGLSHQEKDLGVYGVNEGVYGKVFQSGLPFIVPDISKEPLFLNRTGARKEIEKSSISFIGVPVILKNKPVGVLSVDRLFGLDASLEPDVRFLTVLASLIAQFLSLNQAIIRDKEKLTEENLTLKAKLHSRFNAHFIIGKSKPMQDVYWNIERVSPSMATVLLLGESGTGKELVARAVHEASTRAKNAFVKVNCAALPENLLESELFGHEKGAFTGAGSLRIGRFEMADKGTIFLDEIGEMPLGLQAKLLRILQEKQFERLGSSKTRKVDVRIIAATNVSLEEAIARGEFRNDLYFRLNVVPIVLPPLRKRSEDIPLLLDHFLRASNQRNQRNLRMSSGFLDILSRYGWPGNVRELQNLVERLVILTSNDILYPADLPDYIRQEKVAVPTEPKHHFQHQSESQVCTWPAEERLKARPSGSKALKDMEREEVEAALWRNGWIQARAARDLGITPRQMGYRIKKYELKRPQY